MPDATNPGRDAGADAFRPVGEAIDRALAPLLGTPAEQAAPDDPGSGDATSLATIEVTVPFTGEVVRVPNITAFSYSSDVLQVGDPFSVTIPDPRGLYLRKLVRGARVVLSLASPHVAGGIKVRKLTGLIVRRRVACNAQGTVITLSGADLGWHLAHNDGPLWFGLQGCTWEQLIQACIHPDRVFPNTPDPGWGFADDIRADNDLNARLKQGKQGIVMAQQADVLQPLSRIQIEPGEKLFDVLSLYAKRLGYFVNVSADGHLQIFTPNYSTEPSYSFYCYPTTDPRHTRNNVQVEGIALEEGIEEVYTDVTCVGDVPLPDLIDQQVAQDSVNANKFRGRFVPDPPPLDFLHRVIFTDGEALNRGFADERAVWKAKMGLFEGHVVTFTVRHHHQNGLFYEAGTMCHIDFPVVGVGPANYYISQVRCDRGDGGDVTSISAHLPDLLAA